ncbi:exo-poly-alpha-D-galacturonosidase [Niveispirillum lacus]|uniref:Exo-poly-alpha-D-galacturonosidase n=1 Tax=Niveispirillum lacus TaxID=1981099 RepID=A0A255YRW5_9PROT|nr:glycosyl hydrolase family 28-related protein [Niveispirillum lacus]OYQ31385.1 exo-poly-alpha-D-galacturonosidase [Niveispirillum lacus]
MTTWIDIRDHGAVGDGVTIDSPAINRAIQAAAAAGGGAVRVPAGVWLCFSVRLASHVRLHLDAGAVIRAAVPGPMGAYDPPEPNPHDLYQDFGHSHWHNSLIWGDGLTDIAITGPGLIDGHGLTSKGPGAKWAKRKGYFPESMAGMSAAELAAEDPEEAAMQGQGNKAIALKHCTHVTLRDVTIARGGHFAVLATGVDHLTINRLRIDTQRDGLDLDCVRHCMVSHCRINTPNDDAIVLKSSLALGEARVTAHVRIHDCHVSGFDPGSMLDGRFRRTQDKAPDQDGMTGRIKLGTESNGGFHDIEITRCTFERSRGLALETVDGGMLTDVRISDITMREITTAALFIYAGARLRAPDGTPPGGIRGVRIERLRATDVDPRFASIIAGQAGYPVRDVVLSEIDITYRGGRPALDGPVPEKPDAYPEPSMFGPMPAWGLFMRHAADVTIAGATLSTAQPDGRPALWLHDVAGAHFQDIRLRNNAMTLPLVCQDVRGLTGEVVP